MLESVKHSAMVNLGLVNDLLDLAKHQNMTFELHQSFFNLSDIVNKVFMTLRFLSSKKNIKMVLTIKEGEEKYF
jgi:signal transduction histidine kinase